MGTPKASDHPIPSTRGAGTPSKSFASGRVSEALLSLSASRILLSVFLFDSAIAWVVSALADGPFLISFFFAQGVGLASAAFALSMRRRLSSLRTLMLSTLALSCTLGVAVGLFAVWLFGPVVRGFERSELVVTVDLFSGNALLVAFFGSIALYAFLYQERAARAHHAVQALLLKNQLEARRALDAELKVLQAQLEPHFLQNTLTTIASLIHTNPDRGEAMTLALSRYLRACTTLIRKDTIRLEDEAALLRDYLELYVIRMGDRLRYSIEIDPAQGSVEVPPLLLQPLVENGIRHGIEPIPEGGTIRITSRQESGRLVLEVADTGAGFRAQGQPGSGVGIANVSDRLRTRYGELATLAIRERDEGGVVAQITVPVDER